MFLHYRNILLQKSKGGNMVSKAVPIGITVLVVVAAVIGFLLLTGSQIQVGEPFDIPYDECVQGLEQTGLFTKAVKQQSTGPCATMISSDFCEAVILSDESRCDGDQTCAAFVRKDPSKCVEGDVACRAFITQDISLCDEISVLELDMREECKALVSLNHRYFSSKRAKQNCLDAVVNVFASTASDCELINSKEVRASCVGKFGQ